MRVSPRSMRDTACWSLAGQGMPSSPATRGALHRRDRRRPGRAPGRRSSSPLDTPSRGPVSLYEAGLLRQRGRQSASWTRCGTPKHRRELTGAHRPQGSHGPAPDRGAYIPQPLFRGADSDGGLHRGGHLRPVRSPSGEKTPSSSCAKYVSASPNPAHYWIRAQAAACTR